MVDCCKDLKGPAVTSPVVFGKALVVKLKAYVEARKKRDFFKGVNQNLLIISGFAMDTGELLRHGHSLQKDS